MSTQPIIDDMPDVSALRESLATFRQSQIHVMTLPESGLTVRLKKVNLMDLVTQGIEIPDSLSGLFEQSMNGAEMDLSISDIGGMAQMFDMIILSSVIYPPIIDGAGDNEHLGTSEIPFADKQEIFNFGNGEAHALIPFCEKQRKSDLDAPVGEDVRPTAV